LDAIGLVVAAACLTAFFPPQAESMRAAQTKAAALKEPVVIFIG
jgi:hypothetical protein